jgi:hypothetical protein
LTQIQSTAETDRQRAIAPSLVRLRFACREVGLRSNPAAPASTIGFLGLGSITHALTWLVSAPRITHTEVAAADSLRPTSRHQKSARSESAGDDTLATPTATTRDGRINDGHRGLRARFPRTLRAHASVGKRVRKRTGARRRRFDDDGRTTRVPK